jgi:hypothetical protein
VSAVESYVSALPPGEVHDSGRLIDLLAAEWEGFTGGQETSMDAMKLSRAEGVTWHPPIIQFGVERHGAKVLGSVNAEVQTWRVDLDARTAEIVATRTRRVAKSQAGINSADMHDHARQIAALILGGLRDDPRIAWTRDGKAKVVISSFMPPASQQTQSGRSRRFHDALGPELGPEWTRTGAIYRRKDAS